MKRVFLLALMLSLLFPLFFSLSRSSNDCCGIQFGLSVASAISYLDVNVSEAKQMIETNPNLVILDVRTQTEYDSGHIQNATFIPLTELASRLGELNKEREILVYCKSGGRSATASQMLVDNGFLKVYNMLDGITAWRNAGYWIEITHNGDLSINGTQTLSIEDCTYVQTGNIIVTDMAVLFMKNTELVTNQSYYGQFVFSVRSSARLEMENVTIKSDCLRPTGIIVMDNATARINGLTLPGDITSAGNSLLYLANSTVIELEILDNAEVRVSSSQILGLTDLYFDGYTVANVVGLQPGFFNYWNLQSQVEGSIHPECNLTLENTTINHWSVRVDWNAALTIEDSTIRRFIIGFYGADIEINNIYVGRYLDWNLNSIGLRNSSVVGHWLFSLWDSKIVVTDSTINFNLYDHSELEAKNCTISWIQTWYHDGSVIFDDVRFEETADVAPTFSAYYSGTAYHGNIIFKESVDILAWVSCSVLRNYSVSVKDSDGIPVSDVGLTVEYSDTVVWNGVTDSSGQAHFDLVFDDRNYTDFVRLEATKGNLSSAIDIGFFSDTPVVLTLQEDVNSDLNSDGTVNILDIFVVANAFGSKTGDPNWNATADLNKDGTINILDIFAVAWDFGKTV